MHVLRILFLHFSRIFVLLFCTFRFIFANIFLSSFIFLNFCLIFQTFCSLLFVFCSPIYLISFSIAETRVRFHSKYSILAKSFRIKDDFAEIIRIFGGTKYGYVLASVFYPLATALNIFYLSPYFKCSRSKFEVYAGFHSP